MAYERERAAHVLSALEDAVGDIDLFRRAAQANAQPTSSATLNRRASRSALPVRATPAEAGGFEVSEVTLCHQA